METDGAFAYRCRKRPFTMLVKPRKPMALFAIVVANDQLSLLYKLEHSAATGCVSMMKLAD